MATGQNIAQTIANGAIEGFSDLLAPISAFSYAVKPTGAALGDTVKVGFVSNASGSSTFDYENGYSGNANGVLGKDVVLNNLLYQPIRLTDAELMQMSEESLKALGRKAGARLAADVISASFASVVSAANYPASSSVPYTATSYTSSAALADLDKQANNLKWVDGERFLIAGTTLWNSLMQNTSVINAANYGDASAIRDGKLPAVMGFVPYKVTINLPNSDTGFAVTPNAILFGNAYHQPGEQSKGVVDAVQATDERGLTIGYRSWYNPSKATTEKVIECLFGALKGDGNGLIHIK